MQPYVSLVFLHPFGGKFGKAAGGGAGLSSAGKGERQRAAGRRIDLPDGKAFSICGFIATIHCWIDFAGAG